MRALALGLAAVLAFLALATTIRTTDVLTGTVDARRVGTATVTSCAEHGPIGRWGIGTSHECTADVRWDDGTTERLTFPPGQLEPAEGDVPVFRSDRAPGRNDSGRWFLAGPLAVTALGLLVLWFLVGAVLSLVPAKGKKGKGEEQWHVTKEEIKATPVTRRVRRLRWYAWLGLAAAAAEGLASLPFFDAPRRAGGFVSPWPELERAWLVDLPSGVLAGFAVLVAAAAGVVAESVHKDAARVVRYGQSYLDTKKQVNGGTSWVPVGVMAALVVAAVVKVVLAVPAHAPAAVWLAGGRDALVLLALLAITVCTRQSAKDMVGRLVRN
ncbi:hypothetical protein SAMN05216188_118131 [Lentzea xinjiangensis]|uniref:SdpI/YhfL protein family protein n=1 Tax=Lentzea xinjiangensis TaxID=402600 RepID=A0A1H9TI72_9PSEU|nr:DUF6346 domain-containing protein [Lentzea xinjiangensis]SER96684.1 hypothetical protein SAMN05216188_118131 [Lentzea xinjiangensis]